MTVTGLRPVVPSLCLLPLLPAVSAMAQDGKLLDLVSSARASNVRTLEQPMRRALGEAPSLWLSLFLRLVATPHLTSAHLR